MVVSSGVIVNSGVSDSRQERRTTTHHGVVTVAGLVVDDKG